MTSKPQQPRRPPIGFWFKWHFWNQWLPLIEMSYSLSYTENFHFSNFQPPASEAANNGINMQIGNLRNQKSFFFTIVHDTYFYFWKWKGLFWHLHWVFITNLVTQMKTKRNSAEIWYEIESFPFWRNKKYHRKNIFWNFWSWFFLIFENFQEKLS